MKARIAVLPGDGIGPEVVEEARAVLELVAAENGHELRFETHALAAASADEVAEACRGADAVLVGAPAGQVDGDARQALSTLRQRLGLFASVRPFRIFPQLLRALPIKPERFRAVDVLVVSETTDAAWAGTIGSARALPASEHVREVMKLGFRLAQKRWGHVTSVDAANVVECDPEWRLAADQVGAQFPNVRLDHQTLDPAALHLVAQPAHFDVVVAQRKFGEIMIEQASMLSGSIGLLSGAFMGEGTLGLYQPVHGAARDIAGTNTANPVGAILSAAMLLRWSLGLEREATLVEGAVCAALAQGTRTADLGGQTPVSTHEMGKAVRANLAAGVTTSHAI